MMYMIIFHLSVYNDKEKRIEQHRLVDFASGGMLILYEDCTALLVNIIDH